MKPPASPYTEPKTRSSFPAASGFPNQIRREISAWSPNGLPGANRPRAGLRRARRSRRFCFPDFCVSGSSTMLPASSYTRRWATDRGRTHSGFFCPKCVLRRVRTLSFAPTWSDGMASAETMYLVQSLPRKLFDQNTLTSE